ncbi:hypothetical protein [Nonomuraea sp. GTA35]|uniref:hypothetical protein n=1 Tax=Nonomuraea sp. GTA35 TaxID=1676746 RepID=UPI0035C1E6F4
MLDEKRWQDAGTVFTDDVAVHSPRGGGGGGNSAASTRSLALCDRVRPRGSKPST